MEIQKSRHETIFYYPGTVKRAPDGTLSIYTSSYGDDWHALGDEIIKPSDQNYELWLWLIHSFPILTRDQNAEQTQEVREQVFISNSDVERFRLEFQEEILHISSDSILRQKLLSSIEKEPARWHLILQSCVGNLAFCIVLLYCILLWTLESLLAWMRKAITRR